MRVFLWLRPAQALPILLSCAIGPLLFGATPRVTFERTLPATHDVHAEDLALVQAIGDHASVETFVEVFVEQVNESKVLRMRDMRRGTGPAEAYLEVRGFTCALVERAGEGSMRDADNKRVRRHHVWADAVCRARVDVLSRAMQRVSTFQVKGEGTSPRVEKLTDDERQIALEQAARYAAISAAERITPRRVREQVVLDEKAPAFEEGQAMIDSARLGEARAIWTKALRTNARSAPLHYNLAAVCEALGDRAAAETHYRTARDLAPGEPRYSLELRLFEKRR
jgi:tetratricopeptide (TPR) repeat protein